MAQLVMDQGVSGCFGTSEEGHPSSSVDLLGGIQ
jgi:hypothetical protein